MTVHLAWLAACVVVGVAGVLFGRRVWMRREQDHRKALLAEWKAGYAAGEGDGKQQGEDRAWFAARYEAYKVLDKYPTSRGGRAMVRALGGTVPPLPKRPRPSSAPTEETNP